MWSTGPKFETLTVIILPARNPHSTVPKKASNQYSRDDSGDALKRSAEELRDQATLGEGDAEENTERSDGHDVVHGGSGHDQRGHALGGAQPPFLEVEHARDDDGGRRGANDGAEHERVAPGQGEEEHGREADDDRLDERGAEREAEYDEAEAAEGVRVEAQAAAGHYDHERARSEVGRQGLVEVVPDDALKM